MDELERLRIVFEAETLEVKQAVSEIKSQLKIANTSTQNELGKMKTSYSNFGKSIKGVIGKVLAITAIAKFGNAAINMASDLEETQNVVDVAFGEMSYKANEFAKNSILMAGMSEQAAKKVASTHMAMARGMQLPLDRASDMSLSITQMSADMASFFNTSTDVADTALRSIWTGETETLKKYGVVMTQANLEQYAMRNGLNSNIQAMTQAEQATLRYSFVMDTLNYVSGDFARNSDSWANQTRVLGEQFKQLGAIIGSWLIQALKPLVQLLNTVMSGIIKFAQLMNAVFGKLFGWNQSNNDQQLKAIANQSAINSGVSKGAQAQDKLGKATEKAGKKAKGALASFDQLNILQKPQETSSPSGGGGGSIGGLGDVGGMDFGLGKPMDTGGFDASVDSIMQKVEGLKVFFQTNIPTILSLVGGLTAGISYLFLAKNWGAITEGVTKALTAVKGFFGGLVAGITSPMVLIAAVIALVVTAFIQIYNESENFRNVIQTALDSLGQIFQSLWNNFLSPILTSLTEGLLLVWEYGIKPLWDGFKVFLEQLATLVLNVWNNVLAPLIKFFIDVFGPIIAGVIDVVIKAFAIFGAIVGTVIGAVFTILGIIIEWINGVFKVNWKEVLSSIAGFFSGLWNTIFQVVGWIWDKLIFIVNWVVTTFGPMFKVGLDFVIGVFSNIWNTIKGIIDGIIQTISGITTFITGVFTGNWRKAWDGVKNIFGGIWNSIKSLVKGVWDFILNLFNTGGKIFDGIVGAISGVFKTIVNALISGINRIIATPFNLINGLLNTIRSIGILGIKPFEGLWSYNPLPVPKIPHLAVGTNYVAKDGLAMIHQGEAVVPKKYNPALGSNNQLQIALLEEQNSLLKALLEKDTNIVLDGDKISKNQSLQSLRRIKALGY